ncbi:MAG: hypothetical protein ACYC8T_21620 [Myxococcaceae bacterium]
MPARIKAAPASRARVSGGETRAPAKKTTGSKVKGGETRGPAKKVTGGKVKGGEVSRGGGKVKGGEVSRGGGKVKGGERGPVDLSGGHRPVVRGGETYRPSPNLWGGGER